ncbi:MAG: YihY/virulence factor BrkB family protein [Deltaproteobacteria bacterium]|nr:YihY/virulence factor BrkB family protein [Deltaproteobacteria bacterium]NND30032.1 YihY/virulence factor BrkB family protein [Myxococcales bacterium]MBT8466384.1 YihY/virulence factor BrkB family protein [Deltaproteobacteria bacterium]MBT8480836.1 YihY/virulence factor BrkB family protein [Deltaproteobacteria bacterium]NNK08143.1 YihY/virulence factor BrkB family protein [Myxococcales bacterium]
MVSLLIETWRYFASHDGRLLSGAIAFYASLAIAPLGVVALLIASLVMSESAAREELVGQVAAFLGPDLARFLIDAIVRLGDEATSFAAPVVGAVFMLYISARLFSMLRRALNHMWGIRPKLLVHASRSETLHLVERRLLAFAMVLVFGSSLIALVLLHSGAAAAAHLLGDSRYMLNLAEFGSAFAVIAPLIALVYRWLPDAVISWRDVWVGAAVTCLFVLGGSFLIGIYLGYASPASIYGAAGSLIVLLLWIYYTTQIFLLGAVFTRAWARQRGRAIEPLPFAEVVETRDYSASVSASET